MGVRVEAAPVGAAGVGFGEVSAQQFVRGGLRDTVGIGVVPTGEVAHSVQDAGLGFDGGGDSGDAAGDLLGRGWLLGVTKDGQ